MYRDFLERPLWQQYVFIFVSTFLVFLMGYFLFIEDIEYQSKQQHALYQKKLIDIQRLQEKMQRYESTTQNKLTWISERDLAHAIERCHLTLQAFKYYKIDEIIYWDIELHGQFFDFVALMSSFIEDYYYLDFQKLMIRKDDSQLSIKFTLSFNQAKR